MSDFESFRESVKTASSKFTDIALQTLKKNVKTTKNGLNRSHVKPPFCRWPGVCPDKQLRIVYYKRGVKRRYQLCRSKGECNQKTEKPMYYEV